MNFLKRAVMSQLSHCPSRRCLFLLRAITQSSMYSTTYRLSKPQPRKPRTTQTIQESSPSQDPPSSSSSLTWGQRVQKQAKGLTDWPKPSEIPYQAKVANSVNLIGQITTPVKFQSAPDGKYLAGAVISQENDQSFVIPVVFEDDLAHVASSHVKINDCVYVVGRLSEDPLPFVLGECQGKFHVVVENINFVEGFEAKTFRKAKKIVGEADVHENKGFLHHSSETPKSENCEPKISQPKDETAKDGYSGNDPWKHLVKDPSQWRDFRGEKATGSVVAKHPDFKHKKSRTSLWLSSAPKWMLQEIQKLSFDVEGPIPEQQNVMDAKKVVYWKKNVKNAKKPDQEDSWRSLVESPNKWWDNRLGKKNAKAPDFRHKETGEGLWLNGSPSWVLSKLPEMTEKWKVAAGK